MSLLENRQVYEAAISLLGKYFNNEAYYRHYALNIRSSRKCIKISLRQFALNILNEMALEPDGITLERIMKIIAIIIIPSLWKAGFSVRRINSRHARYIICRGPKAP